ncbi:MBL fold metallo-hydrolase [Planktothrix agardhii]|jgi:phosphoribosyl 1,2-cyclic phosphodiesterase|uniref:Beta-lactamase-like protein n=2 Tax=Planktothrix agardhii TaxID=1160 RepID=A0AAD1Q0N0_PLAAG|nr:MBL fold metallo-hydrolase [Planktothrix agardhii]MBG0748405.1 MBL fold metallo-hydrolase [Planktothrix agardhii KL2]MCB8776528.1 MBL fold metallo-hydrolase [Planktothrix agardhii 1031]MCB8785276.1 MBL fold metallo-hydrolase [Planktothrix agardhii 1025]MCF3599964.1 MBL fold metallo-hydrolase [Planktothrix agardhii 1032]MCF3613003.1 MBL fold metallo-hydrolase [Planktothrix agardhii 1027]
MSNLQNQFTVHFWGVRGSIACPGSETVRYGGNTPCVEMRVGSERLIFDGGTGLRVLGQSLLAQMPVTGHLFFSHYHWDHIQGFPFFVPAFIKINTFYIYGTIAPDGSTVQHRLNDQMLHPNFPVPLQIMGADLKFVDISVGKSIKISDDIIVETALLNHPGEAVGYRVNWRNYAAAYVSDTEHFPDRLDENVLFLARNADVLIYDATYTNEEYYSEKTSKVGWGHSTWQEAVKVAKAANVKRLVIFHHDPLHNDDFMDKTGEQVAEQFPNSLIAREGLSIQLSSPLNSSPPVSQSA